MDSRSTQSAQPTQSDPLYDFLAWLDGNKKQVITGLAVAAIVGSVIGLYIWNKKSTETKANEALFAIPSAQGRNAATPPTGEAFLKVEQEYPNTSAAERAELIGAGFLFTGGKYDKAKAQFEEFLTERPKSELRSQAAFGIAACLEAQGKIDEAIKKYQEVAAQYKGKNVAPLASFAVARLYEMQDKPEEALKVYSDLQSSKDPNDMWRSEAVDREEKLLAKYPQLAGKYKPAAAPGEQIIEVTTPPEGATDQTPKVRVLTNAPAKP